MEALQSHGAEDVQDHVALNERPLADAFEERIRLSAAMNFDLFRFPITAARATSSEESLNIASRLLEYIDGLEECWNLLANEASRNLMVQVWSYRILGHRHVKLPANAPHFWNAHRQARALVEVPEVIPQGPFQWALDLYNLESAGLPFRVFGAPQGIAITLLLDQYRYCHDAVAIGAGPGDVVLEGGACWGETSLHFANAVGSNGSVYAFEFAPANLEVFERTIDINPHLHQRVHLSREAWWDRSGEALRYHPHGPATAINAQDVDATETAVTVTVDDFVEREGIDHVDFIKMDIEGAEEHALNGAVETLRSFKPSLAISAYHRFGDLAILPNYINNLGLGYQFYLAHSTIYTAETVLFAAVPEP